MNKKGKIYKNNKHSKLVITKKLWYKIGIIFLLLIVFLPFVRSEIESLGTFKTSSCIELIQLCSNCTWQNITSVLYPNSSIAVADVAMGKSGTRFNYTFCLTNNDGQYIVNGLGDVDGIETVWAYDFKINVLGKVFTNSQAILYFLIFAIAIIIFGICLVAGIYLPYNNKRDEVTGYIFAIENLKYFKIFLLAISYLIFILIMYFGYIISYGYLDLDFVGNIFYFVFYALLVILIPGFLIGMYVVISNWTRDSKVAEYLSRGIRIK